jgi:hypothetical protein
MTSDRVEPSDFVVQMAPTVDALHGLCSAIVGAPERNGHVAHVPSVAMGDLASEKGYRRRTGSDWDSPVRDTHTFGGMTLVAAADYGQCYASLFEAHRPPVYGHLAVTRAAMEVGVASLWLNDPKIDTEERVKRGLWEQLYSSNEVVRLALEDHGKAADVRAAFLRCGKALGWQVEFDRSGKPIVAGTRRPDTRERISELFVGRADRPLGRALWSFLSAAIHGTWYGLRVGVVEGPSSNADLAPSVAMIGTDSKAVDQQSFGLLRVLRFAGAARQTLMGWTNDNAWEAAAAKSEAFEGVLIERILRPGNQGTTKGEPTWIETTQ